MNKTSLRSMDLFKSRDEAEIAPRSTPIGQEMNTAFHYLGLHCIPFVYGYHADGGRGTELLLN
jgi:hypothetical protein